MNKSIIKASFIGLTDITEIEVKYSRPLTKGRKIFGSLIPFDNLWRTGADENTIIFFSGDVLIADQKLAKGKYALFTVPGPETWMVIFYRDVGNFGLPHAWKNENIALTVQTGVVHLNHLVESFTIGISQERPNRGTLEISWEKTAIAVSFDVPEQPDTLPVFSSYGPPVPTDFYTSAKFYFDDVGDLEGAYARIKMGLEYNDEKPYFYYYLQALIQAKLELIEDAIASAQLAENKAKEKGNDHYVALCQERISTWLRLTNATNMHER